MNNQNYTRNKVGQFKRKKNKFAIILIIAFALVMALAYTFQTIETMGTQTVVNVKKEVKTDTRDSEQKIADNWAEAVRLVKIDEKKAQDKLNDLVTALKARCNSFNNQQRATQAMNTYQNIKSEVALQDCEDVQTLLDEATGN